MDINIQFSEEFNGNILHIHGDAVTVANRHPKPSLYLSVTAKVQTAKEVIDRNVFVGIQMEDLKVLRAVIDTAIRKGDSGDDVQKKEEGKWRESKSLASSKKTRLKKASSIRKAQRD